HNNIFYYWLCQKLSKQIKLIEIISNELLNQNLSQLIQQILPQIFPILIEKQDIITINSIEKYLNINKQYLGQKYLSKIISYLLIQKIDDNDNILHFFADNIINNEKNIYQIISEKPYSLIFQLIDYCGIADINQRKKNNKIINYKKLKKKY
ncbi:hypothetical protein RFI_28747, partial [Reticulomyxa filosa]